MSYNITAVLLTVTNHEFQLIRKLHENTNFEQARQLVHRSHNIAFSLIKFKNSQYC